MYIWKPYFGIFVYYTHVYLYIYMYLQVCTCIYICIDMSIRAVDANSFCLSPFLSLLVALSLFLPDALSLSLSFSLSLALSLTLPLPLSLSLASASTVQMLVSLSKRNARQCKIAGIPILVCLCI